MDINTRMEGEIDTIKEPLIAKTPEGTESSTSPSPSAASMKSEFSEIISHFSEYRPSFISTPFKGTSLQITRDSQNFVFGSREGRLAVCDIQHKQLTQDKNLEEGSIWTIDITADNSSVYSGGVGGKIKKFSLSNLAHENTYEGHTDEVNCVMLSKDDKYLFSCSDDKTVRKWDLQSGTNQVLYTHEDGIVLNLDLSQDNVHVASCSRGGSIVVFNNVENEKSFETRFESAMWCIKISSKNSYLIAGDDTPLIYVWSFGNWNLLRTLSGHISRVRCLEIASNEKFFVSGGIDSLVKVWDLESWRDEVTIYGHTDWVKGIIISKDHSQIHTMSDDCRIMTSKVPDLANHINLPSKYPLQRLLLNKREKLLYGASGNKLLMNTPSKGFDLLYEFARDIVAWSITFTGTRLAVFLAQERSTETEVVLVDLFGHRSHKSVVLKTSSIVCSALASENGTFLITGEAFRVTVWGITGEMKHIFRSHAADVTALTLQGDHLFAGDRNGIIRYYYLDEQFSEIAQFAEENQTEITMIRLRGDQKVFFSATSSCRIHVWSIETQSIITEIATPSLVQQIYFTEDNLRCFISHSNTLEIWNLENFSKCSSITFALPSLDIAFSADERDMYVSFNEHFKKIENPLKASHLSVYGTHADTHHFVDYVTRIISGEVPKYNAGMNNWLIEPYHINVLHLYAYFNLHKSLRKAIRDGASFFPSKSGHTPLSISIDKKLSECVDIIFEGIRGKSDTNPLAFYYFSDSFAALNRSSYPKLQILYDLVFRRSFSSNLPKFCEDTVELPIVKQSTELFLTKERFTDPENFKSETVAIEFVQSYVKFSTEIGSDSSLDFLKSLIECKNLEVYSSGLVKVILDQKWKVIRWVFIAETLMYLVYLIMICEYAVMEDSDRNNYLLIAPFVINVVLFLNEIVQMVASTAIYFKSFWNYIDMSRFLMFSLFCALEVSDQHEFRQETFLLIAVVLSLIRGLSYFRIHTTTRWVVNLIFDVFYQLWALIIVATYSILALGVLYRSFVEDTEWFDDTQNAKLQWLLFFFVLVINPIIMLNLFIAIIGDAFEKSQDEKTVKCGQELADMIYEGELLFFWNRKKSVPKFIHTVREEHIEIQAQNTAGQRIKKISENMEVLHEVAAKNKAAIADLKAFVESKILQITQKTESILEAVKTKA